MSRYRIRVEKVLEDGTVIELVDAGNLKPLDAEALFRDMAGQAYQDVIDVLAAARESLNEAA